MMFASRSIECLSMHRKSDIIPTIVFANARLSNGSLQQFLVFTRHNRLDFTTTVNASDCEYIPRAMSFSRFHSASYLILLIRGVIFLYGKERIFLRLTYLVENGFFLFVGKGEKFRAMKIVCTRSELTLFQ